jgi:hypothetical protein
MPGKVSARLFTLLDGPLRPTGFWPDDEAIVAIEKSKPDAMRD